jgi:4-aminobutyrate aminotransferase / (S)-3-amino-2-methylpropionate transaminase / 5-aminovalerate transaminase
MTHTDTGIHPHRRMITDFPGPRSAALHERRAAAVALQPILPVYVERAAGALIEDVDGNTFIDFGSGIGVLNVGNTAPAVVDRVRQQVERFTHTAFLLAPYEEFIAVCEHLNRLTPGAHDKRSVLFTTGAEAVENAVKVARAATRRTAIVVFEHAFHGRTNLTMAMTAKGVPLRQGFGPFANEVYRAPMSYPFRDGIDGATAAARAIDVIERTVGRESVAAIVIEPIQGEGGFIVPAEGFLPTLAAWAAEAGALFVADEIQSGFGRSGDMFAVEHEKVVPDVIITAKSIAGGLPLSAVTARAELYDRVQPGGLGGTYAGNPLACAAALATFESFEQLKLVDQSRRIGVTLRQRLSALQSKYPIVGDVRGRGAMQAMEFVNAGTKDPNPQATAAVAAHCRGHGLLTLTTGTWSNVVRLMPPLVISDDLLEDGLSVLEEAVAAVSAG